MVPLQWEPAGYLVAIMTLIHHDIFAIDSRYVGAVMSFHCDHYVYRSSRRRDLLAHKRDIADRQHSHSENYLKSEMTFCHRIAHAERVARDQRRVVILAEKTTHPLIGRNLALHSYKFLGGSM